MLQFSAKAFFWCGRALRTIREDCIIGAAVCVEGEVLLAMPRDLEERAKEKALSSLPSVEAEFRKIGLTITADTVKELSEELEGGSRHSFQWLHDQVEAIERLADKELKGKFFLYIPPERAKFWPKMNDQNLFGREVADKFHSAAFDIANSGVCLATMMSTASVFHLMRVLEVGLATLGKVFGVSLAHTNWQIALDQIEKAIRGMHADPSWNSLPDWKEQKGVLRASSEQLRNLQRRVAQPHDARPSQVHRR